MFSAVWVQVSVLESCLMFRLALTLDLALHHLGVCRLTRMPATPLLLGTVSPNGGRDEWQVCQCPGDGRAARGA